jgi:hypothetical protein
MPHSIATLVGKKKQLPMVLQTEIAHTKKTSSRLKYIDGFIPSMSVNYRHNISVGQGVGDCEICTKLL